MPRHGELTPAEKASAVLAHRGWPKNTLDTLTDEEEAKLVQIYDKHIAPMAGLNAAFDAFWASHRERLDAAKAAADDPGEQAKDGKKGSKDSAK